MKSFALAVSACLTLAACGPSGGTFCDSVCDCADCGSRAYDDCLDNFDDEEFRADRRGCLDQWDDYVVCIEDDYSCSRKDFGCDDELDDYRRCVD